MSTIKTPLDFKVYDSTGTYQASAKEPHAAALLAEHYEGTVRWIHKHTVWQPGDLSPLESFDRVTVLIEDRCAAIREAFRAKRRTVQQIHHTLTLAIR